VQDHEVVGGGLDRHREPRVLVESEDALLPQRLRQEVARAIRRRVVDSNDADAGMRL
jgi:hypothetical protein